MNKKKAIVIILAIIAGLSFLLPDLYSLGMLNDKFLYFYKGSFVLCSGKCFIENGQLMYYKGWLGSSYTSISVFFIVGIVAVVMAMIGFIGKFIRKIAYKQ